MIENETILEEFYVSYEKETLKNAYQLIYGKWFHLRITIVFLMIFALALIIHSGWDLYIGIAFAILLSDSVQLFQAIRVLNQNSKKPQTHVFHYQLTSAYLNVSVLNNKEITSQYFLKASDINQLWENESLAAFSFGNGLFIIKKTSLPKDSTILRFLRNAIYEKKLTLKKDRSILSRVLVIASITSVFAALFCISRQLLPNGDMIEYMWIFFLFIPVPLTSIIYGILRNHNGYQNRKNILIGVIILILLCLYGSFTFMF
ncbi:MAG: hypothetical protein IJ333_04285 [Clostridia bacterium]|nr:hypothetical protein [Clostridia bacterium]